MQTILIVDDDKENLEALGGLLQRNFRVVTAATGAIAVKKAAKEKPDIAVVDVQMPGMDGIEVCKRLRATIETKVMPIIMTSAYDDEQKRTESFLWGADDFIAKPFSSSELLARITSKLSWTRQPAGERRSYRLGNLDIDERKMEVSVAGAAVKLTQFEFVLLKHFISNADCVLSREQLLRDVWRDSTVTPRTVDTHVYGLRRKLAEFDHEFTTIHGAGYILKPR